MKQVEMPSWYPLQFFKNRQGATKRSLGHAVEEQLLVPQITMLEKEICECEKLFEGLKNLHVMSRF